MPSIYIVEDNHLYLKYLENYFSNQKGYDVTSFSSGEECLAHIHQKPDYVILDYFLNEENPQAINGGEVFNEIINQCPKTKVIVVSAQQNGELVLKLVREGLRDYVIKDENTLTEIENIIEEHEKEENTSVSS